MLIWLDREHKQVEGMPRHRALISTGERERSDHAKLDVSIYHIFIQRRTMAPCPKLPLDLRDHLCGRSTVLLRQSPLFGDENGCARVGLGVNDLALTLVLLSDLLLVRRFPHLPLRRREDTSIHPSHCDDGSSRRIRRDCLCSAGLLLAADATVARASRDDAAADSGLGVGIIGFIVLGLAAHLLDEDSIRSFQIRVPFCSHCSGDGESRDRVWLTGQEEEGRLFCAGINLVFLPF